MAIKILIVDDHPFFRAGLHALLRLQKEFEIVAEAKDGQEAVELALKKKPDVVIMDISMPGLNGIEATRILSSKAPEIKVLALSIHSGKQFMKNMLNAGAKGYMLKDSVPDELVEAINTVNNDEIYLSPDTTKIVLEKDEQSEETTKILTTKLHPPPVTLEHLYRLRLIDFLDKNKNKPFTLVSAPAGYGKSMLISSWLDKSNYPFTWISLSSDENDLRSFLEYIDLGIKKIVPDALKSFTSIIHGSELPSIEIIEESLINGLDEINEDFVLVLDDYHLISNPQINNLIDTLLKFPPQQLHLVIITRRDPALDLVYMRAHSRMNEIRMNDLRFTKKEIEVLFKKNLEIDLKNDIIEQLYEKTEGWITGLRLASLAITDSKDAVRIISNIKGERYHLGDFLTKEVLLKQPTHIQTNLLRASFLNRFSASLVDELILKSDKEPLSTGQEFIDWLIEHNLFLIALDSTNEWYRFHHLFQELLVQQLRDQYTKEDINSIHLLASSWFDKEHLYDEAIDYALVSENMNRVVEIIEAHGHEIMNQDGWYIVAKWLSLLSEEIIQERPELLILKAWKHYYHFEIPQLISVLDRVDELLGGNVWLHKLSGEVSSFRGFCALFMNDSALSYKYLKHALNKIAISDVEFRVETELLYGIAGQMEGEYQKVIDLIDEWLQKKELHPLRQTRLLLTLIFLHYISGSIKRATLSIDKQRIIAAKNGLENGVAWSDYLSGIFNLQQGNIEKAITLMEEATSRKYYNYTLAAVDNLAALAVAYQVNEDLDKVAETLKTLNEFTNYLGQPFPVFAQSCASRISLMQGNISAAKQWLDQSQPNFNQVMIWWFEQPIITRCRVLIAEGSVENIAIAENELRQYAELSKKHHNQLQLINIKVLQSLMYQQQKNDDKCVAVLKEALAIAEPGGFIFPFLEPGEKFMDCLKKLPDTILNSDFVKRILHVHEEISQNSMSISEVKSKPVFVSETAVLEPLSFREMDVIKLLAKGLRNKEIAKELFLSIDTVKKHNKNIFQKLDVHSRIHAVRKAIKLGLIEQN